MAEPPNREYLIELLVDNLAEDRLGEAGLSAEATENGYVVAVVAATETNARIELANLMGVSLDSMRLAKK